jgi:hypothetical protein
VDIFVDIRVDIFVDICVDYLWVYQLRYFHNGYFEVCFLTKIFLLYSRNFSNWVCIYFVC